MRIPLAAPEIREADIAAVTSVLRTRRLSLGPKLAEFEGALAEYVGTRHAVAVNSGTAALHLCLHALGIRGGDEVIVPSFAFIAVANVVRYVDAMPVFADINAETLNLDPRHIQAAITPRTRAIIVVHTFGVPAAMREIQAIADRRGLTIIEDTCEALGAEYDGRSVGSLGAAGIFGFYPNKQITAGEGGAVVTSDAKLAATVRMLRNQGRGESDDWFQHTKIGFNYRLSEMNCALALEQLNRCDATLQRREAIARRYSEKLRSCPHIETPALELPGRKVSWFVYAVRLEESLSGDGRDRIVREMAARGIGCGRYFAPIHRQPAYTNEPHRCGDLSVTDAIAPRMLALPFFNAISDAEIDEVCETLTKLARQTPAEKAAGLPKNSEGPPVVL